MSRSLCFFALLCSLQSLIATAPVFKVRPFPGKSRLPLVPPNGKVTQTQRLYAVVPGKKVFPHCTEATISLTQHKEGVQLSQLMISGGNIREGTLLIAVADFPEFAISRHKNDLEVVFKKSSVGNFSKDFKVKLEYPNECESHEFHEMNLERFLVQCGLQKKASFFERLMKKKSAPPKKLSFLKDPTIGHIFPKESTKASSNTIIYHIENSDEKLEQHFRTNAMNVEEDAEEAVAVFTKSENGVGIEELIKVSGGRVQKFSAFISTEEYLKFTAKRYSETVLCVTFKANGENAEDFGILLQHTGTHQEHKAIVTEFLQSCGFEKITGRFKSLRNSISGTKRKYRRRRSSIGLAKKSTAAADIIGKYLDAKEERDAKKRVAPIHWRVLGDTLWAKYGKIPWEKTGKRMFIRFWDYLHKQLGEPEEEDVDLMADFKSLFHSMTDAEKALAKELITEKTQQIREFGHKELEKRGMGNINTEDFRTFMESVLSKKEKEEE